jgi:sugar lactone lactonase YvrE
MKSCTACWSAGAFLLSWVLLAGANDTRRLPIPDKTSQAQAVQLVEDIFKEDIAAARDPASRSKLATVLLQQGKESRDDPATRYVLYSIGADLAAQAGDATLALSAAENLARDFDVSELDLKATLLTTVAAATTAPEANKSLVDLTLALLTQALDADNYVTAVRLGKVAEEAARKSKSVPLVNAVLKRNVELLAVQKGFAQLQPFVERLKQDAADPEANLKLGEYYGLLRGKWQKALPLLARGSDNTLKTQARKDLAGASQPHEKLALADGWWELAALHKDPARLHLQQRAGYWYEQAVVDLKGLNRTKAQRRMDQVAASGRVTDLSTSPGPVGEIRKLEGHTDEIKSVAFSPDGRQGLSGSVDMTMRLWDLATGSPVQVFKGHTKQVWGVAYHPNGRQVVSASWDTTARLWEAATGQEIRRFQHPIDVNGVAFSHDGKWLLTGCDDHNARLWDVATGQEVRRFMGHTRFVYGVAFSPDGRHLASGGVDQSVRIFDLATANEVHRLDGHTNAVTNVAYAPDGRSLFSCGDSTVRMWDTATGKEVRRFEGSTGQISAMALSPDGRRLLTGSDDKTVRLWDVASARELHRFEGHTDSVICVAISSDGRRALSGSVDRTARLWGLPVR